MNNGNHTILLTGDIEKFAEKKILNNMFSYLPSEILIVPHHGSKTSNVPRFISAVHPQFVFYATGYRNRYHFPHQKVREAYQQIQAKEFNTADLGTLEVKIRKNNLTQIKAYRLVHKRYWMDNTVV